ncbi:protein-tyrosine-phosphatase [Bifidobacterium callimiconis]|uniref:Protein-tyrosine-phosphatase n=1 Tax=Bifidobacterium callimiconis TaxID=2306973 RepID=A0A430FE08_9BIFI|nr:low molecular weight phosphatase family protein [Bifidobacterium callimiconis]RSX51134.1 protein-tyrosine-phosphatase [Bifidobacterium callimiconis]
MHIMFVCTGNVCRSPMGELMMKRYLAGSSITVSSAGVKGLKDRPIHQSSGKLMTSVGIDSSAFRSRMLTAEMAQNADLILCFEKEQRRDIVSLAPMAVNYTFLVTDFANMCLYSAQQKLVKGRTLEERLQSVINAASFIRPMIPAPRDVDDPMGKSFDVFCRAAEQTNKAIWIILDSMRKHYTDSVSVATASARVGASTGTPDRSVSDRSVSDRSMSDRSMSDRSGEDTVVLPPITGASTGTDSSGNVVQVNQTAGGNRGKAISTK